MNQYELAKFFREKSDTDTDVNVTRYLDNIANYQNVRVDVVLKNKEHEIAIEHKDT